MGEFEDSRKFGHIFFVHIKHVLHLKNIFAYVFRTFGTYNKIKYLLYTVFVSPHNLYVETLNPSTMVCGDGVFGIQLCHEGGAP